ncbi:MAG: hypothetical protein HRT63_13685 [Erythrobacter sp.]|nr:hypothetical protein [Erythrobacter sp.]
MKELASFLFGLCGGIASMGFGFALFFAIHATVKHALVESQIELHSDAAFSGFTFGSFFLVAVAILVREYSAA